MWIAMSASHPTLCLLFSEQQFGKCRAAETKKKTYKNGSGSICFCFIPDGTIQKSSKIMMCYIHHARQVIKFFERLCHSLSSQAHVCGAVLVAQETKRHCLNMCHGNPLTLPRARNSHLEILAYLTQLVSSFKVHQRIWKTSQSHQKVLPQTKIQHRTIISRQCDEVCCTPSLRRHCGYSRDKASMPIVAMKTWNAEMVKSPLCLGTYSKMPPRLEGNPWWWNDLGTNLLFGKLKMSGLQFQTQFPALLSGQTREVIELHTVIDIPRSQQLLSCISFKSSTGLDASNTEVPIGSPHTHPHWKAARPPIEDQLDLLDFWGQMMLPRFERKGVFRIDQQVAISES